MNTVYIALFAVIMAFSTLPALSLPDYGMIDFRTVTLDDEEPEEVALIKMSAADSPLAFQPRLIIKDSKTGEWMDYLPMGEEYVYAYGADIFFEDMDGDGHPKILIDMPTGGNGGAGSFAQVVLNYSNGKITPLLPIETFETGFSSELQDGNAIKIMNQLTGYSESFKLSDDPRPYFDAQGNVLDNEQIMVDTFYEFTPVDIDNDGVFEIAAAQYVSLWGHSDMVGTACSILKYDADITGFKVVKTAFFDWFLSSEDFERVWIDANKK